MPTARALRCALFVSATALALPVGAADSSLSVTVRDNYGVIPRATVRATGTGTGASHRATTDDAGVARFPALPAATYEVRATFPGFADAAEPAVTLARARRGSSSS